jgi:hypothetical protein
LGFWGFGEQYVTERTRASKKQLRLLSEIVWNLSEIVWNCLKFVWNLSEIVWNCLKLSEIVWNCLKLSEIAEIVWNWLKLSEIVWNLSEICLKLSEIVWNCLKIWSEIVWSLSCSSWISRTISISTRNFQPRSWNFLGVLLECGLRMQRQCVCVCVCYWCYWRYRYAGIGLAGFLGATAATATGRC